VKLFIENYDSIKNGSYKRIKQPDGGSFHYAKEMKNYLEINLDDKYIARELFNLLRAKKFSNSPQCYFYADKRKYEVEVKIAPPPP
jgi:hypothetical protein